MRGASWRVGTDRADIRLGEGKLKQVNALFARSRSPFSNVCACFCSEDGLSLTFERYFKHFIQCIVCFGSVSCPFRWYSLDESYSIDDSR